jgi:hypothetical protein
MPVRRRALASVLAIAVMAGVAASAACSSEPERSVANYCSQVEAVRTIDEDLASGDAVRIGARAEDLRLLQQVAPTDIEPSVAVLLGVTDDFARTAGTATDRSEVADAVFRGRSADIAGIEAAGNSVAAYTRDKCQIDLGGGSAPAAGTGGPTTAGEETTTSERGGGGGGAPTTTTTSTPSLLVP